MSHGKEGCRRRRPGHHAVGSPCWQFLGVKGLWLLCSDYVGVGRCPRLREPLALALGGAEAPPLAQDPCLVLPTEGPALRAQDLCGRPPTAGQLLVGLASVLQPNPMALAAAAAQTLGRTGFCLCGKRVRMLVRDRARPVKIFLLITVPISFLPVGPRSNPRTKTTCSESPPL